MKNHKKLICISIFGIFLFTFFLIPRTTAQEWTYDGVDTTNIPGFSVYPTEWYIWDPDPLGELFAPLEITHGNISDPLALGNGTCVWGNAWMSNKTSGELILSAGDWLLSYWNETVGYNAMTFGFIIPVENNGILSSPILNNVSGFLETMLDLMGNLTFENKQAYPNIYSIAFWNETDNNAYSHFNYTDDGILTQWESYLIPGFGNATLYSQPAQLPPAFSFTTESGSLSVNTTDFKLNITITDADNNNDGIVDTDYQYRIQNGSTWSAWASPPSQLDWDLGAVADGSYPITMEVKNMYGVTQQQITIQYTGPEGDGDGAIPSYPIVIISLMAILSVALIILKQRKKLRFGRIII